MSKVSKSDENVIKYIREAECEFGFSPMDISGMTQSRFEEYVNWLDDLLLTRR